ncbi:hypothetical protein D3C81_764220 [compost metagenome]
MYRWKYPIPPQGCPAYTLITQRATNVRRVQRLPYAEARATFDDVCNWLTDLGIQYHNTRLHKYKTLLIDLANAEARGDYAHFENKSGTARGINGAFEAQELIRIHEGLRHEKHPQLVERLRRILQGHELFASDKSSGRDLSLELSVAARFAKHGHVIDFGHIADLSVMFHDTSVFVECKRLKSKNKVKVRIKDGLDQLHQRYRVYEPQGEARGLLVLSIGALFNGDLTLFEGSDARQLGRKVTGAVRDFVSKYRRYWEHVATDKRTIGVIIIFDTPAHTGGTLSTCQELDIHFQIDITQEDSALLHRIAPLFAPDF